MKLFQRLSYTALNLPTSAAGMPIFIFILPFYADDLGLGLSLVGIIFFLGRFTDILTDPIMINFRLDGVNISIGFFFLLLYLCWPLS